MNQDFWISQKAKFPDKNRDPTRLPNGRKIKPLSSE
jgi:hypothetical protein